MASGYSKLGIYDTRHGGSFICVAHMQHYSIARTYATYEVGYERTFNDGRTARHSIASAMASNDHHKHVFNYCIIRAVYGHYRSDFIRSNALSRDGLACSH